MPDSKNVENSLGLFGMSNAKSPNEKFPPNQELKNLFKKGKKPWLSAIKESNFINNPRRNTENSNKEERFDPLAVDANGKPGKNITGMV
jgi:hypothetical protein